MTIKILVIGGTGLTGKAVLNRAAQNEGIIV